MKQSEFRMRTEPRERGRYLKQIESLLANDMVLPHHIPYILEAKRSLLAKEPEMDFNARIIFAVYRSELRGYHLRALNKEHPKRGKHRKERSPEHKAKIAAAAMERWKRAKERGEYANGKKPKAKTEAKKATD